MAVKINLMAILVVFFIVGLQNSHVAGRKNQQKLSVSERHKVWMARHGRVYKDELEKTKRRLIFKQNMEFIESVNSAGNISYKLGLNEFADITSQEFMAKYTGLVLNMHSHPSSNSPMTKDFKINDISDGDMPTNLDWRDKEAITPVKNQGRCGCCWAFSAVGAIEGAYQIATGQQVELSAQELLDCTSTNRGCGGGYMTNAFDFIIQNGGISTQSDYPYQMQQDTCRSQDLEAVVKISSYQVVDQSEEALMQVVTQQPVSIGISISDEFRFYQGGTYHGSCGDHINHAVLAIGYGSDEQGQNYWLVKNSWGTTWGEGGFFKIVKDTGNPQGHCDITKLSSFPVIN